MGQAAQQQRPDQRTACHRRHHGGENASMLAYRRSASEPAVVSTSHGAPPSRLGCLARNETNMQDRNPVQILGTMADHLLNRETTTPRIRRHVRASARAHNRGNEGKSSPPLTGDIAPRFALFDSSSAIAGVRDHRRWRRPLPGAEVKAQTIYPGDTVAVQFWFEHEA